jgi:hypothetical protein
MYHLVYDDDQIHGIYTCAHYADCACRFIKSKDIPSPNLTIRQLHMNEVDGVDVEIISKLLMLKPRAQ